MVNPATWTTAFNLWLSPGLYIVKHSAFAINGVYRLALSMSVAGVIDEQQTDRATDGNQGVRGVIGNTIYHLPVGGTFVGTVYINYGTTTKIRNNLKILKL